MTSCTLCPRNCGADRTKSRGVCGCTDEVYVAKVMLHKWEEPCISGTDGKGGSGAVFFCGCPLGCSFCQNKEISRYRHGFTPGAEVYSEERLAETFTALQADGAYNINLVSPTQYTKQILRSLKAARAMGLRLPVVWNTGGYEKAETVRLLENNVSIFLTDLKYKDSSLSSTLSGAPDYFEHAMTSLREMVRIAGVPRYEGGIMTHGVVMRHLVLPGARRDSVELLRAVAEAGLSKCVVLSLMSQYTPDFFDGCEDPKTDRAMRRRVTTFEYEAVVDEALRLGFDGYIQERSAAVKDYTPEW